MKQTSLSQLPENYTLTADRIAVHKHDHIADAEYITILYLVHHGANGDRKTLCYRGAIENDAFVKNWHLAHAELADVAEKHRETGHCEQYPGAPTYVTARPA